MIQVYESGVGEIAVTTFVQMDDINIERVILQVMWSGEQATSPKNNCDRGHWKQMEESRKRTSRGRHVVNGNTGVSGLIQGGGCREMYTEHPLA